MIMTIKYYINNYFLCVITSKIPIQRSSLMLSITLNNKYFEVPFIILTIFSCKIILNIYLLTILNRY